MAIEDSAHRVGDRLVVVVALDQDGEDAGDGAFTRPGAGALQEPRQLREHSRRITFGARRLAGRQPDLALRHREAGDRIHQQQNVLGLIAEVLGDGEREIGRLTARQRWLVGGRNHHHRTRKTLLAEIAL